MTEKQLERWMSYFDECHGSSQGEELEALIRAVRKEALEEAGDLWESVNPSCDHEPKCGAGAMGVVLEYRDKIRALTNKPYK